MLLGGARSGKSDLALRWAEIHDGPVTFVATATAGDRDMANRIERHQSERPDTWGLIEEPRFDAAMANDLASDHLVVVDCLTMLVTALMLEGGDSAQITDHIVALAESLASRTAPTIVVSNEVGMGVVPATELGRTFRDDLGRANRTMTDHASTAALLVAGQLLPLSRPEDWQ